MYVSVNLQEVVIQLWSRTKGLASLAPFDPPSHEMTLHTGVCGELLFWVLVAPEPSYFGKSDYSPEQNTYKCCPVLMLKVSSPVATQMEPNKVWPIFQMSIPKLFDFCPFVNSLCPTPSRAALVVTGINQSFSNSLSLVLLLLVDLNTTHQANESKCNNTGSFRNVEELIGKLTAHNWQKWKRVFLTCPCNKIYRDEV